MDTLRSGKQKIFVIEYLKCGNATEAARIAGYKLPNKQGWRLLQDEKIKAVIARHYEEQCMGAIEVLGRLADIARATPEWFLTINEAGEPEFDFKKAEVAGKLHLIKKLWRDRDGNWRVELHDSLTALAYLGRHHALFVEKHEHEHRGYVGVGTAEIGDLAELEDDELEERINRLGEINRRLGAALQRGAGSTPGREGEAAGEAAQDDDSNS